MLPATSVSKFIAERNPVLFSNIGDMHNVFVCVAPLQLGGKYVSTFFGRLSVC